MCLKLNLSRFLKKKNQTHNKQQTQQQTKKEEKMATHYDHNYLIINDSDLDVKINNIWKELKDGERARVYINKKTIVLQKANLQLSMNRKIDIYGPKYVIFRRCGDGHIYGTFPTVEYVLFESCDKNFNYYCAHKSYFPNLKKIYMAGHPAEYRTKFAFPKEMWVVSEYYDRYFNESETKSEDMYLVKKHFEMIAEFNKMIENEKEEKSLIEI